MRLFKYGLSVEHDSIDPRHLLEYHQHDADHQRLVDARVLQVGHLEARALTGNTGETLSVTHFVVQQRWHQHWGGRRSCCGRKAASPPSRPIVDSPAPRRRPRCGRTPIPRGHRVPAGSAAPPRPLASCPGTAGTGASPAWSTCRPSAAWVGWSCRSPASASPGRDLRDEFTRLRTRSWSHTAVQLLFQLTMDQPQPSYNKRVTFRPY